MTFGVKFRDAMVIGSQVAGALVALVTLAFWPPAHGRMLLVPVTAGAEARLIATAVERGGLIVGRGGLPGSVVIEGDRSRLMEGMIARGVIAIAAPDLICGARQA